MPTHVFSPLLAAVRASLTIRSALVRTFARPLRVEAPAQGPNHAQGGTNSIELMTTSGEVGANSAALRVTSNGLNTSAAALGTTSAALEATSTALRTTPAALGACAGGVLARSRGLAMNQIVPETAKAVHRWIACAAAFALLVVPTDASGQMTLTTQARSISISSGPCGNPSASAPDFGPFVQTVTAPGGRISQNSTLSSSMIVGTGSTGGGVAGASCPGIRGSSQLSVTFTVSEPVNYTFTFQSSGSCGPGTLMSLTGPGTNIAYDYFTMFSTEQVFSGTLQPGLYTLAASVDAGPTAGNISSCGWSVNLMVTVPDGACCTGVNCTITSPAACAGRFVGGGVACNPVGNDTTPCCRVDVNQVGGVTVQDIFDFLAAWFAGNTGVGNFNNDCCVSTQDIFDFLAAWFAGC